MDKDGNVDSFGILGAIPESIGSLNQLRKAWLMYSCVSECGEDVNSSFYLTLLRCFFSEELRLDNNFVGGTLPTTLGRLKSLGKRAKTSVLSVVWCTNTRAVTHHC